MLKKHETRHVIIRSVNIKRCKMMHKYKTKQSFATFMNVDLDTKTKIVPRINYTFLDKLERRLVRLVRTDLRIAGYKVDGTNIYW